MGKYNLFLETHYEEFKALHSEIHFFEIDKFRIRNAQKGGPWRVTHVENLSFYHNFIFWNKFCCLQSCQKIFHKRIDRDYFKLKFSKIVLFGKFIDNGHCYAINKNATVGRFLKTIRFICLYFFKKSLVPKMNLRVIKYLICLDILKGQNNTQEISQYFRIWCKFYCQWYQAYIIIYHSVWFQCEIKKRPTLQSKKILKIYL